MPLSLAQFVVLHNSAFVWGGWGGSWQELTEGAPGRLPSFIFQQLSSIPYFHWFANRVNERASA